MRTLFVVFGWVAVSLVMLVALVAQGRAGAQACGVDIPRRGM